MPPLVALFVCCCGIFFILRQDLKFRKAGSAALWIPGIWLTIISSRPLSYWFNPGGGGSLEGNPINTVTFALLIFLGLSTVKKRGLKWESFARENKALVALYLFMAVSMVWSPYPFASGKRLLKDFGCVICGLVFLTEADPAAAIRTVFVRISYGLFPLSLAFGKYFPDLGRGYSMSGEPFFSGVTTSKNTLGQIIFVYSIILLWDLVELRHSPERRGKKLQIGIRLGMLGFNGWFLVVCNSRTSLLCAITGAFLMWACALLLKMPSGKKILGWGIAVAVCIGLFDQTFGVSDAVIRALGRDSTLTGRTKIWEVIQEQKTNSLLGEGFYIFWDTEKGSAVVQALAQINSAHNGFYEVYIDGGIVGVSLLSIFLLSTGKRAVSRIFTRDKLGPLAVGFWATALIYNVSESSFLRLDPLWFTLLLFTMCHPVGKRPSPVPPRVGTQPVSSDVPAVAAA